jgi:hypothetical protein
VSTTRVIFQGAALPRSGISRRSLPCALLLPLAVIFSAAPFSAAEEAPPGPSGRMAGDLVSGDLQVELFRTAREPAPPLAVAHAQGQRATRPTLLPIIGAVRADMGQRLEATHALGRGLSREETTLLCQFLKSPADACETDLPGLRGLKNEILNVLRRQRPPPAGLTETLLGIYRDPAQDSVIRDYAIQHLVVWYQQGPPEAASAAGRIRAALFEAAAESGSIAGTALLSLHLLAAEDPTLPQEDINRLALCMVCSTETQVAARITAIQVCAERGLKEAVPAIQSVAAEEVCLPLRLSAIAALTRLTGGQQARVLGAVGARESHAAPAAPPAASPQPEPNPAAF